METNPDTDVQHDAELDALFSYRAPVIVTPSQPVMHSDINPQQKKSADINPQQKTETVEEKQKRLLAEWDYDAPIKPAQPVTNQNTPMTEADYDALWDADVPQVVLSTDVRKRRKRQMFTDAQLRLMFHAHQDGYTPKEIAAYLNTTPEGARITVNAVHNRLKRGYVPPEPLREITPAQAAKWLKKRDPD